MMKKPPLVVLRSWTDDPPKIKGIAPEEDERPVKVEPDHQGHFLTQEITDPELDPKFTPRGRTFSAGSRNNFDKQIPHNWREHDNSPSNGGSPEPRFFNRRKTTTEHFEESISINRHSYAGFCESETNGNSPSPTGKMSPMMMGRSLSNLHLSPAKNHPNTLSLRPGSAGTISPDNHDGSSMEYTPPSSPISGRYSKLCEEVKATIPKRGNLKSSWITGIKSRYNQYALRSTLDSDED